MDDFKMTTPTPEVFMEMMQDPTRCYITGCDEENEILLHMQDDPWRGSDVCLGHAKHIVENSSLILTCSCPFCERARKLLPEIKEEPK